MWDAGVDLSSSVSTFNKYEQKYEGNIGQYYLVFFRHIITLKWLHLS